MNTSPAVVRDKIYDLIDPDTLLNYYEEKRIRFSPPASIQRYYAAVDILSSDKYEGQIRKVRYHIYICFFIVVHFIYLTLTVADHIALEIY